MSATKNKLGKFYLRIEDTDKLRSKEDFYQYQEINRLCNGEPGICGYSRLCGNLFCAVELSVHRYDVRLCQRRSDEPVSGGRIHFRCQYWYNHYRLDNQS